jgi:hypothetical protein
VKHGSKDKTQKWSPRNHREYHTALKHPITSIALKRHAHPDLDDEHRADDLDHDSDLARIDIPHDSSWKVDVYESKSDKDAAITLSSEDLGILLTLKDDAGSLHEHTTRRIGYSVHPEKTEDGLKNAKISKAVVTIDGKVAGTLNPIDLKNQTPGICRIVFRTAAVA